MPKTTKKKTFSKSRSRNFRWNPAKKSDVDTNREISEKWLIFQKPAQWYYSKKTLRILWIGSTQYLKQNCLVNIPLIKKTEKNKRYAYIVTPEKVHQVLLKRNGVALLGRKIVIKKAI